MSDYKNLEKSISLLSNMFKTLQRTELDAPDNRRYSSNFASLYLIKINFSLNQFKRCEPFAEAIRRNIRDGIGLESYPKSWRVQYGYY